MKTQDIIILVTIAILLFSQGLWMFYDAGKRNEQKWLWGFLGLIHFPSSLIIYLIVTRKYSKKITCPNCYYTIDKKSIYCSYCGHELTEEEKEIGSKEYKNTLN